MMEKNGWWINFIEIKYHYKNDVLHNPDGPAVIWLDGQKKYWIEGVQYTKDEFENENC